MHKKKLYFSNSQLYYTRMLVPSYNMISYIDNTTNDILLHVNIWFDVELVNVLLLSYSPRPVVKNGTT
jgi:hypothetical protein